MIGNDVVDLQLAKTQSNWQRKGFLEKQFTINEQEFIAQSENAFIQVWMFWSMKEAAYKCYTQKHPNRFFAPKKFECKMISSSEGNVSIHQEKYNVKIEISDSYVYSVAFDKNEEKVKSELFLVSKNYQSKEVNNHLLHYFPDKTLLKKDAFGIPFLVHQQKKLPFYISTSHHGNFGAYAILEY